MATNKSVVATGGNQLRGRVTCVVPFMLRELNVVEQRCRVVLEVLSGSGIAGAGSRVSRGQERAVAARG